MNIDILDWKILIFILIITYYKKLKSDVDGANDSMKFASKLGSYGNKKINSTDSPEDAHNYIVSI
ncbi:hypothetical protein [Companilactobacillus tucceti]|uniref:hypothetical protein n=1 Tax=Companilactobacillus tucceti TaxID=238012 RepID=UPI00070956DD|nr:hypothetical protein [Companilactobacillus tucceti]